MKTEYEQIEQELYDLLLKTTTIADEIGYELVWDIATQSVIAVKKESPSKDNR